MLREFFILQKARRRLLVNSLFRARRQGWLKFSLVMVLGALFIAGDYWFFRRILVYFNSIPGNVGEILVIQLLNLLCLTFFSMLIFSNVIASLSSMFLSRDLDLLISSPIPIGHVFLSKFIHTMVNSSWMAVLFSLPVFVAYGEVFYAPWGYYAALAPLMIPFLVIPSCIGVFVTMTLMRYFPAKRTYQVLSFVGIIFIGGLVVFFRLLEPEKFLGKDVPEEVIIEYVERLKVPDYEWLPSSMTARALQAGAFGDWPAFNDNFLWLSAIALAFAVFIVALASRIFYRGWSAAYGAEKLTSPPARERALYRLARIPLSRAAPQTRALMLKDIKLFWRDTGQWSQLFMLGALVIVYIFNIRNLPLETVYLKNVISVMNIGLAGVVLAAVAARFVYATTSMEGGCFWVVKSAPVDFSRFLWEKFFLYLIPLIFLAEILVVVSNILLEVDAFVMAISAGTVALLTVGLTGLGVGMGAIYPKFDYENVAEVAASTGAILYMIIALAYAGLSVMLCARPVYTHLFSFFTGRNIGGADVWFSYVAMFAVTAAMVYFPMKKGARALERMEI